MSEIGTPTELLARPKPAVKKHKNQSLTILDNFGVDVEERLGNDGNGSRNDGADLVGNDLKGCLDGLLTERTC